MATYEVVLPTMHSAMEDVNTVAHSIKNLLDELETHCQSTLSQWTGDAQSEYNAAKTNWDNAAANIPAAVNAAAAALNDIADSYNAAENSATSTFGHN